MQKVQKKRKQQNEMLAVCCFKFFPFNLSSIRSRASGASSTTFGQFPLTFNFEKIAFFDRVELLLLHLGALTSCTGFRQQLLHNIIVCNILSHSRVLDQLLLNGNTNVMTCQQLLQFLKCLQRDTTHTR